MFQKPIALLVVVILILGCQSRTGTALDPDRILQHGGRGGGADNAIRVQKPSPFDLATKNENHNDKQRDRLLKHAAP